MLEVQAAGSTYPVEFLDRHPWLPILLLLLLPIAVCMPLWLFGFSTDPVWYISAVTSSSQPFPGYPFLDPNAGFTSEALGRLSAWDWVHGIVPWWNPYTGIGMPLAGEMQPGAFFLPFNLLFLLKEGVLWQKICMQIIAGLATYALLRELKLSRLASLMGGAVFAFNSVLAWTPGPAAGYCSLPFLPLLLWGIERARSSAGSAASILALGSAIAWSILAGFPEPAYISGLLALAWGVYRLAGEPDRWAMARRACTGFVLGLLVAAPLLIAFADYLRQSDSFSVHLLGEAHLPLVSFAQTMMPYVYGPMPSVFHSAPMGRIWGSTGGYAGSLLVLMALAGLCRRSSHSRLRILLAAWVCIAWAKTLGIQPVQGIMNFIPLLRRAAFFRYADASWIFALVVLAAFGLDELRSVPPRRRYPFAIAIALLAFAVGVALPGHAVWERPASLHPLMYLLLGISVACVAAEYLFTGLVWTRFQSGTRRTCIAALLIVDAMAMFAMPMLSARRHRHIDTDAIQFLHDHQGLARTYAMGPLEANYGAYFQAASIDHNALPVPGLWARYADTKLLPGILDKSAGVGFQPQDFDPGYGEQALRNHLSSYLDLDVRYVLTFPRESPATTQPSRSNAIGSDLPSTDTLLDRVTFLKPLLVHCRAIASDPSASHLARSVAGAILKRLAPYAPINAAGDDTQKTPAATSPPPGKTAPIASDSRQLPPGAEKVYADTLMEIWQLPNPAPYFEVISGGPCTLDHQGRESLTADCQTPALLMRRELFMPGWNAVVNGRTIEPKQQRTIFQSVPLPAGRSDVRYRFVPPHMTLGWLLCAAGLAGLLWQVMQISRRKPIVTTA